MSELVLDSSFALQLALPDERSDDAERFLARIGANSVLWVPVVWWFEVSNALLVAERRKRITEAVSLQALELYRSLPIQTDSASGIEMVWPLRSLGHEYDLSAYDAAYLQLAARRKLSLATLDRALVQAARKAGVEVLA